MHTFFVSVNVINLVAVGVRGGGGGGDDQAGPYNSLHLAVNLICLFLFFPLLFSHSVHTAASCESNQYFTTRQYAFRHRRHRHRKQKYISSSTPCPLPLKQNYGHSPMKLYKIKNKIKNHLPYTEK